MLHRQVPLSFVFNFFCAIYLVNIFYPIFIGDKQFSWISLRDQVGHFFQKLMEFFLEWKINGLYIYRYNDMCYA